MVVGKRIPGVGAGEEAFFKFLGAYGKLVRKNIPGSYHLEYGSRPYMAGIHEHLEEVLAALPRGSRILDLGCGRGHFSAYLRARGLMVDGIDVGEVKAGRQGDDIVGDQGIDTGRYYPRLWRDAGRRYGMKIRRYNGRDIPFPGGTFDAVMFYAVYEHIPEEDLAYVTSESFRVLKKGGKTFIFRCPSSLSFMEHLAGWLGLGRHAKLFSAGELKRDLREAGYEILSFSRTDFFPHYIGIAFLQKIINLASHFYPLMEGLLAWTPLRLFFHHFKVVARKPALPGKKHA